MIGQNIGKYRVLDRVGRGGMGTVYRAVDETLHRDVAIKVLNAELNDPEVAKRFRAEAITVARLSHPGIATIYELFQHDGQWLMVMEFVRGETLEGLVTRLGALSAQRTAELCMQTLAALAHAHSMGVVHRDLKPANIMVTESGAIKVMDFGIARVAGTEHLTSAGFMMGTPAYMAPEQVMGHEIDARADLYAMGVVFYRLTTGKLPFKGETAFAMAQSQVNDSPTPIGLFRSDLPAWVEQVVVRALAKSPDDRFQSAIEFHESFSRCLAGQPMSSQYSSSAPTELLMTPPRAMPTGPIQRNPTSQVPVPPPASIPGTASQPGVELEATMLSPTPSGRMPTGEGPAVSAPAASPSGPVQMTPAEAVPVPVAVPLPPAPVVAASAAPAAQPVAAASKTSSAASSSKAPATPSASATRKSSSAPLIVAAVAVLVVGGGGAAWWMAHRNVAPPAADPAPAAEVAPPPAESAAPSAAASTPAAPPVAEAPKTPAAAPAATTRATGPAPTATASTAAPPARGPVAPPIEEVAVSFPQAKLMVVSGRKADDVDVSVSFADGRLDLLDRKTGAARGTMPYASATAVTYFRGRDPKWDAAFASPPQNLDVGGVLRTAKHWLVLQTHESYLLLRLDDSNWRKVIETVEARIRPVTVATEK